jgi:hypothetical protein
MTKRIASQHLHPPVVYPCSFEKPGYFLVFPGPSSVKVLPQQQRSAPLLSARSCVQTRAQPGRMTATNSAFGFNT